MGERGKRINNKQEIKQSEIKWLFIHHAHKREWEWKDKLGIFPAFILKGGHIFTYVKVLWKCIKINMVSMAAFYLCPQKTEWTMLKSKAEEKPRSN